MPRLKIAVIGTGRVGAALGRGWVEAGHTVVFGTRTPERDDVRALVRETGASAARPSDAASGAEVVVLATPWNAAEAVVRSLGDLSGKTLVDATNPIGPGLTFAGAPSGGEQVARWAEGAHVVKAFNTTGYETMADTAYPGDVRPVMFLAGDASAAKTTVAALAETLGFEPIDAGGLGRSVLLEHLALLWITQAMTEGAGRDFAFAVLRR